MKQIVKTPNAPGAMGPYSQGVIVNGLVFTAGQLGIDPATGQMVSGIEAQTAQVIKNISAILEAAGTTLANAVKATVFLRHVEDFAAMNTVYIAHFSEGAPARSTVEVSNLPHAEALIEIEVVATL
jgi:2-iminobutanoate/2-iminopropanoate deaminase